MIPSFPNVSQTCFDSELGSFSFGYDRQLVIFTKSFHNATLVNLDVEILFNVQNPTWGINIFRWRPNGRSQLVWNSTLRVCDMSRRGPRNPIVAAVIKLVPIMSNFSMTCPILAGHFHLNLNVKTINDYIPMRIFYEPNSYLVVAFKFYEQFPIGNLTNLGFYRMALIVNKKCERRGSGI